MKTIRRRRRISLVEVAVAIALLLILLGGLFATLGATQRAEVDTREREAASRALFQELDALAALPFDELQVGSNLAVYAFGVDYPTSDGALVGLTPARALPRNVDLPGTTVDESRRAGHVSVVRDPDGDGSDDLLELQLTVAWIGADGRDQRLSISTRRARP